MKIATAIAISLTIFLFPTLTGSAQEEMNIMEYDIFSIESPEKPCDLWPSQPGCQKRTLHIDLCRVKTEVDLFTEEETHQINCNISEGLIEKNFISFSAIIGATEEESTMLIAIVARSNGYEAFSINHDAFIKIDQTAPYIIKGVNSEGFHIEPTTNEIKDFLTNVKNGKQRLVIRMQREDNVFGITQEITEAMPLNSQTTAAVEDFLNRTQNLPAFRIQD